MYDMMWLCKKAVMVQEGAEREWEVWQAGTSSCSR